MMQAAIKVIPSEFYSFVSELIDEVNRLATKCGVIAEHYPLCYRELPEKPKYKLIDEEWVKQACECSSTDEP